MTPKEKAEQLYDTFFIEVLHYDVPMGSVLARSCAIKCVDDIVKACSNEYQSDLVHYFETGGYEYWKEVREYLQKM